MITILTTINDTGDYTVQTNCLFYREGPTTPAEEAAAKTLRLALQAGLQHMNEANGNGTLAGKIEGEGE